MCGIVGFVGQFPEGQWGQMHHLLGTLLVESEERGTDATGFCAVTSPFKDRSHHKWVSDKAPLPASKFIANNSFWNRLRHQRCCSVLGHVRYATSGPATDNRNNHPFVGKAGNVRFSMVHNGIIHQHQQTAKQLGLSLRTGCDSELIEKLISHAGNIADGLTRCLTELSGSMAIVVMEHRTGTLWLARDHKRPLVVAPLSNKQGILIASTPNILLRATDATIGRQSIRTIYPLTGGVIYRITPDGQWHGVQMVDRPRQRW